MPNGFVTSSPSSRYGDSEVWIGTGYVYAQKFTCGGSGTQDITEIGCYIYDTMSGQDFRLSIFTDDSGNSCPESMVSNSETTTITTSSQSTPTKEAYIYTGSKPQLIGGAYYWLLYFGDGGDLYLDCFDTTGIDGGYLSGESAWTWPTGNDWHSMTNYTAADCSLYAVYESASTGGSSEASIIADVVRQSSFNRLRRM